MTRLLLLVLLSIVMSGSIGNRSAKAQESVIRYEQGVPSAVRLINKRGLKYLAQTQNEDGIWPGQQSGPGITAICIMALMASGEDPDFGPYAGQILYEIMLRSNAADDLITFQFYDLSENQYYDICESYTFVIDDIIGDLGSSSGN